MNWVVGGLALLTVIAVGGGVINLIRLIGEALRQEHKRAGS